MAFLADADVNALSVYESVAEAQSLMNTNKQAKIKKTEMRRAKMRQAIAICSLCLTLLAGSVAQAAPKKPVPGKVPVARAAPITEIQVIEYGMQGPHDSGSNAFTWRLWPDRVNTYAPEFNWDGIEMRDPRSPVQAAALGQGDFSGLVRYLQSTPLMGKMTAQGSKGRPGGGPAGDELQIIVVRGGKRVGVTVPSVYANGQIDASSSASDVAAWVVYHLVQSITTNDNWGEVAGGRVDTGLLVTFDTSLINLPENERPVFVVVNAMGKEVATMRDIYGNVAEGTVVNRPYSRTVYLLPGTYRVVKKERAAGTDPKSAQSKAYNWVVVPSTYVIKSGKFVDVQISDSLGGVSKLMWAAEANDVEVLRSSIERGLPVDVRGENGYTALLVAVERGNLASVRLLLDKGARVDVSTPDGWTALMMVSGLEKTELASLLIEKGADINAQGINGDTALRVASRSGQADMVRFLIDKGALVNARDENGVTALMNAVEYKEMPPFEGPPFDEALEVEAARALIEKGAQVNAQDKGGQTALMIASRHGKAKVVSLLLALKADVNLKNKQGKTALALAADEPIRKLLRAAGAR